MKGALYDLFEKHNSAEEILLKIAANKFRRKLKNIAWRISEGEITAKEIETELSFFNLYFTWMGGRTRLLNVPANQNPSSTEQAKIIAQKPYFQKLSAEAAQLGVSTEFVFLEGQPCTPCGKSKPARLRTRFSRTSVPQTPVLPPANTSGDGASVVRMPSAWAPPSPQGV
jgi:hypothetical protein